MFSTYYYRVVFLIVLVTGTLALARTAKAEVVIANSDLGLTELRAKSLKNVYLGKTTKLSNGKKVTFAVLKTGEVHKAFLNDYVKKTPKQFTSHWLKLVFSGRGTEPRVFETETALVAYVARTPGCIGYIGQTTDPVGVTVLSIK